MPHVADLALWACAGRVLGVPGRVLAGRAADIPLPLPAAGARALPGALAAALRRRPVRASLFYAWTRFPGYFISFSQGLACCQLHSAGGWCAKPVPCLGSVHDI